MDFKAWWYGIPAAERANVASELKRSEGYLNMIAGGFRRAGESLAIEVERVSSGAVTVEEQRPDVSWHVIRGRTASTCSPSDAGQENAQDKRAA